MACKHFRYTPTDEGGNITITAVLMCLLACFLLVGVADLACAMSRHSVQENAARLACDSLEVGDYSLVVKNSDNPEEKIAQYIASSIVRSEAAENKAPTSANFWQAGSTVDDTYTDSSKFHYDEITVWVKEADAKDVGDETRRAIAVYVQVKGSYSPMSLGITGSAFDITSTAGCYLIPYSGTTAWRPETSATGSYTYKDYTLRQLLNEEKTYGGPQMTYSATSECPSEIDSLLKEAIVEIHKQ